MAQPDRKHARELRDQHESDALVLVGELVELVERQHVEVAVARRDRVVTARPVVEESEAAEKLAATESRRVLETRAAANAADDTDFAAADQVEVGVRLAARINDFVGLPRTFLEAVFEVGKRI